MIAAVIKDPHFRFGMSKPTGRKDTFFNEISDKIEQIIDICDKYEIKDLICTGDILDIKAPSLYDFKSIKEIYDKLNHIKDSGIKIYSVAGNHDLPASSLDRKSESVYQFFVNQGLITDIEPNNNDEITGFDFRANLDDLKYLIGNEPIGKILVLHEMLIPKPNSLFSCVNHLTYDEVVKLLKSNPKSKCKIVIGGHLHIGYENQTIDDITFINVWSLTRLARDVSVVTDSHTPEICILDSDELYAENIKLKVLPYKDAFIKKEVEQQVQLNNTVNDFIVKLGNFSTNVEQGLKDLPGVSDRVKEKIENYIERARNG